MSSLIAEQTWTEYPESNYENTLLMSITSTEQNLFYSIRNIFNHDKSPTFIMTDRDQTENFRHHSICQYPMFAILAKLGSVRELLFEKVAIKLNDPLSTS